ncbi:hypothetical protein RU59_00006 [Enterobacter phage phiEap-1]|uniref:Uncharacterized protein n=1 Tax=Enterobacter phage phiEap-1 TaxID=1587520 RepID=A0A0K2FGJ8_9CAUD|nr:hypothetical protein RU59_00006 [Enterobacter phage phiEap-1]ALA45069.1 hypothetical protein RU59_00006 [Enterobacter phage phiEap-1]
MMTINVTLIVVFLIAAFAWTIGDDDNTNGPKGA